MGSSHTSDRAIGSPPALAGRVLLRVEKGGERLDRFLAAHTAISRSQLQRLIEAGEMRVNGRPEKPSYRLEPGDQIEGELHLGEAVGLAPETLPLTVLYKDQSILVVDKPPGLTVHPAPGHPSGTLVNAVLALCPELRVGEASLRPGIVHRLDKDTSGVMVIALDPLAQATLMRQFQERTMTKEYLALLQGRLTPERGAVEAPIGRDPRYRQRMAVVERGRPAMTRYRVLEYPGPHTLVEVKPETGRTHQIRVHFAAAGHPVVGDRVYGRAVPWCPRQFLHARLLGFRHPQDGRPVEFRAELPADLRAALEHAQRM